MRVLSSLVLCLFIFFLTFEVSSWVLSINNLLIFNDTPKFYLDRNIQSSGTGNDWRNEKMPWGVWHKKSFKDIHITKCFRANYRSNSIGARGEEFSKNQNEKQRFILLGDSFAEGFGVNERDHFKTLVENNTGTEIINFGASGDFGILQYYILYTELASRYEHDGIIILFNPGNDFTDNDYRFWQVSGLSYLRENKERYRPYFNYTDKNIEKFFYPEKSIKRDDFLSTTSSIDFYDKLRIELNKYLWSYNSIKSLKFIYPYLLNKVSRNHSDYIQKNFSGYYDAYPHQQEFVMHYLEKLIKDSDSADILLVVIPNASDINRKLKGEIYANQYWYHTLNEFELVYNERFQWIDLNEYVSLIESEDMFFSCDPHWSKEGHKWAGRVISKHLDLN